MRNRKAKMRSVFLFTGVFSSGADAGTGGRNRNERENVSDG